MIVPGSLLRLVLDTNVLFAGMVSESSASQRVVDALSARRAILLLSPPVLAEYRSVLMHPASLDRFTHLTPQRIAAALHRLRYVADEYPVIRVRFAFPRDPRDAMFIELAMAGTATHLVTLDNDLLSLPTSRTDAGKRFRQRLPALVILPPSEFLQRHGNVLGFA